LCKNLHFNKKVSCVFKNVACGALLTTADAYVEFWNNLPF
jgi:hypothetical protein